MRTKSETIRAMAAVVVLASLCVWAQPSSAAICAGATVDECGNVRCPGSNDVVFTVLNLQGTTPASVAGNPNDIDNPGPKFDQRVAAAVKYGTCQAMPPAPDACGGPDLGQEYQLRVFARLASGNAALRQEAIQSLASIARTDFGEMGTDGPLNTCGKPADELLRSLALVFSNAARHGDGDAAMIGFIHILYKYGNLLPPAVFDNLLGLIDLTPGAGSVETISFGADPVTSCPLICAATGACPGIACAVCLGACAVTLEVERVTAPETENHINLIYVSQYLANQLWLRKTGDLKYDNSRNGYRALVLNRMRDFVRNDFLEYNSHNYQDYTMYALLALYSYAEDPAVVAAAKMALDYVSAKVAVSSNDGRRSVPFRRRNEDDHRCGELVLQKCNDPQTAYYMMLAGVTDILEKVPDILPSKTAPATYAGSFLWAGTTNYKLEKLILDLFVDRSHRRFYQFFRYARKLPLEGAQDTNVELYAGSPSYLISAGGRQALPAYTADAPFPISVLVGSHPSSNSDLGIPVATTLMPTGELHAREEMIRFFDPAKENMCVAPDFACGLIPPGLTSAVPPNYQIAATDGNWKFIDKSKPLGQYGYYVAVYERDGFGFFEVYDTYANVHNVVNLADFKNRVLNVNQNAGRTYSATGVNTYKTIGGSVIEFMVDAKIVSIDGNPPYDPNRTNGTIINNDGAGVVTITNPALGQSLTLDASPPPNQPRITVPGPVNFPATCIGATSFATLDVCNLGSGADDLFVYNILSQNTEFQVTEPSSGYPTTIGANFCFPFQAQFTPKMIGEVSSKLRISNSDPEVPLLNVTANGTGVIQSIATVISNGGNFGNVCVGAFTDLDLTISNTGGCTLIISGIASSAAEFTVAATVSFPLTVQPGGSVAVPIRFHPSKFQGASGNITVTSNDPATPSAVVAVSGNAPPPVINATIPNGGNFGNVCAGTQADLGLQVVNQGLCPLTISGVNTSGGVSFALPSVTAFPLVLAAGGSVNLPVRFQPPAYGSPSYITCSDTVPQATTVVIHSDDPAHPDPTGFVRPVSGIEGCPQLVLSPENLTGALAFPATVSDPNGTLGCYTDRQITIGNAGICPLHVASLTTSNGAPLPAAPLEFTVVQPTTPVTVAPGAAPVPVTVRFRPVILASQQSDGPDQQTGTLTIVSNDPVPAHNAAGLCGEPTYQSGARVLVVDSANQPVGSVASITLASKGLTPPFSQTLKSAPLRSAPNVCGKTIQYHLDNETLRPAGTTGNNPRGSYTLSAKNGSTQANMSFTLGQCEMEEIVLQIKK